MVSIFYTSLIYNYILLDLNENNLNSNAKRGLILPGEVNLLNISIKKEIPNLTFATPLKQELLNSNIWLKSTLYNAYRINNIIVDEYPVKYTPYKGIYYIINNIYLSSIRSSFD